MPQRLAAVRAFAALPEAAGAGRGQQARRQHPEEEPRRAAPRRWTRRCCVEPAEAALHAALADGGAARPTPRSTRGDYTASLQALAALKAPVDAFFDAVMVNADDAGAARQPAGAAGARCTRR